MDIKDLKSKLAYYEDALKLEETDAILDLDNYLTHFKKAVNYYLIAKTKLEYNSGFTYFFDDYVKQEGIEIDLEIAEKDFNITIKLKPDFNEAHVYLAKLYYLQKKHDNACLHCAIAIKSNHNYVDAYIESSKSKRELGRLNEAIKDLDIAIKINAKNKLVYYERANVFVLKNLSELAIIDYTKVLEIDKEYFLGFFNRANQYINIGLFDNAIADLENALLLRPYEHDCYLLIANIHEYIYEDFDNALKFYELINDFQLNKYSSYISDAYYYFLDDSSYLTANIQKSDDDLTCFKRIEVKIKFKEINLLISQQTNNPQLYFQRGNIFFESLNYEAAVRDYSTCILLDNNNPDFYNIRGECNFKLNKYLEAINDFSSAIKLDNKKLTFYKNRCAANLASNNVIEAYKDFRKPWNMGLKGIYDFGNYFISEIVKVKNTNWNLELAPEYLLLRDIQQSYWDKTESNMWRAYKYPYVLDCSEDEINIGKIMEYKFNYKTLIEVIKIDPEDVLNCIIHLKHFCISNYLLAASCFVDLEKHQTAIEFNLIKHKLIAQKKSKELDEKYAQAEIDGINASYLAEDKKMRGYDWTDGDPSLYWNID
jgi:tetratricopeptide (TPR) repeat protein